MEITGLLEPAGILLGASLKQKDQVLDCLTSLAVASGAVQDGPAFRKALEEREGKSSTNFGRGLAVPHAQGPFVSRPVVVALILKQEIPWGSSVGEYPGEDCDVFFCIGAPAAGGEYLQTLACLMGALRAPGLDNKLRAAASPQEFLELLGAASYAANADQCNCCGPARVVAVTGCPTGIAHTYLAADALQKAGIALGIPIKVETNGSIGVQNELTKDDIRCCDAVIVAADRNVDVQRFVGKRVIFVPVTRAVYHAQELVERAMAGEAPVYQPGTDLLAGSDLSPSGIPQGIYRHLMNGVAHMLPFVVAGGILVALGMLLDDYQINPQSFGENLPLPAFLTLVGTAAFSFMLPICAGYIAHSIAGLPALAVGFVGGALAAYGTNFYAMTGVVNSKFVDSALSAQNIRLPMIQNTSGGFLAAILAGFLAGYVILGLQMLTRKMPASISAIKPSLIYPVVGILVVGAVVSLANPLLASVNTSIENTLHGMQEGSRIIFGAVLGGMMALDMGGPINKAAYLFATAALASGDLDVMAAVMVGGMAPPLSMALATTLFARSFPPAARRAGGLAYILGLCFITEGAIPFAVADPLRVIPSCLIGGIVSGGLSMAFHCTLGAPQGGLLVLPLVNRPIFYLIALAAGSLAGALSYGVIKAVTGSKGPDE